LSRIYLICLLLVALLSYGCENESEIEEYTKVESQGAHLTYGLISYMSFEDVMTQLKLDEKEIEILDDSKTSPKEKTPPFNILSFKVPNQTIRSINGDMIITFFNNRLMEIRFYPVDIDKFIKSIDGLSLTNNVVDPPFIEIWQDTDFQGKSYVGWVDQRLKKQFASWIKKYS